MWHCHFPKYSATRLLPVDWWRPCTSLVAEQIILENSVSQISFPVYVDFKGHHEHIELGTETNREPLEFL